MNRDHTDHIDDTDINLVINPDAPAEIIERNMDELVDQVVERLRRERPRALAVVIMTQDMSGWEMFGGTLTDVSVLITSAVLEIQRAIEQNRERS